MPKGNLEKWFDAAGVEFRRDFVFPESFTDLAVYRDSENAAVAVFLAYLGQIDLSGALVGQAKRLVLLNRADIQKQGRFGEFHTFSRAYYQPFLKDVGSELVKFDAANDPINKFEESERLAETGSGSRHGLYLGTLAAAEELVKSCTPEPSALEEIYLNVRSNTEKLQGIGAWDRPASNVNPLAGEIKINYFAKGKDKLVGDVFIALENLRTSTHYFKFYLDDASKMLKILHDAVRAAGGKEYSDSAAQQNIDAVKAAVTRITDSRRDAGTVCLKVLQEFQQLTNDFASWAKSHTVKVWKAEYAEQHGEIEGMRKVRDQAVNVGFTAVAAGTTPTVIGPFIVGGVAVVTKLGISAYDQLRDGYAQLSQEVAARSTESTVENLEMVSARKAGGKKRRNKARIGRTIGRVADHLVNDVGGVVANIDPTGFAGAVVQTAGTVTSTVTEAAGDLKGKRGYVRQELGDANKEAAAFALSRGAVPTAEKVDPTAVSGEELAAAAIDLAGVGNDNGKWSKYFRANFEGVLKGAFTQDWGFFELTVREWGSYLGFADNYHGYGATVCFNGYNLPSDMDVDYQLDLYFAPEGDVWYDTTVPDFDAHGNQGWKASYWNNPSAAGSLNADMMERFKSIDKNERYIFYCYDRDVKGETLLEAGGLITTDQKINGTVYDALPNGLRNLLDTALKDVARHQ